MSFKIDNGKMRITRPDGVAIFDSDDKLFHVTNTINETRSIPQFNGGGSISNNQDITTTWDLGTVHSSATQVIGAVKFTLNNPNAAYAYDRWHMVMGGTMVWVMDGAGLTSQPGNTSPGQYVGYHFRIQGGVCQLVRRLIIAGTGFSYSVLAHDIQCKLKCGVWV